MVNDNNHDCRKFLEERRATVDHPYHFVDSGLPNVYLVGIKYRRCAVCGMRSADIPAVKNLLMALARTIVESDAPLTGAEIRFLRKRLGKKSSEFAKIIGVSHEQVSRWENGRNRPEQSADKLIRVYYCHLSGDRALRAKVDTQIESWLSAWSAGGQLGRIRAQLRKQEWKAEPVPAQ